MGWTKVYPGPRDQGHGRVPGLLRVAQRGEGDRLDSGLPGAGRAGTQRQADAEVEPRGALGRLEEGRPGPERGGTPDGVSGLGARATPASTAASSTDGSRTPSRKTPSKPSSAGCPRSTTHKHRPADEARVNAGPKSGCAAATPVNGHRTVARGDGHTCLCAVLGHCLLRFVPILQHETPNRDTQGSSAPPDIARDPL